MTYFGLFDGVKAPALSMNIGLVVPDPADIMEITYRRGRSRPDQKYDPGTMTVVLDNASGDYDPDNDTNIRPGVKSTLFATWDSTSYPMFTGTLERPSYDIGFSPTIAFTFTDASALLQVTPADKLSAALTDVVWDGEPSSSDFTIGDVTVSPGRVQRIFNASPLVPFGSRTDYVGISNGVVPMPPIRVGKSFADIFDECALVEGGRWWLDGNGDFHFELLSDKFTKPTRLYLTDSGTESGAIAYDRITVETGYTYLINECVVNVVDLSGSYLQVIARHLTASDWGTKSRTIEAPLTDAADAQVLAKYYAQLWSQPRAGASSISFAAHGLDDYAELLQMDLGDFVVADRNMPVTDYRGLLRWDLVVEGIEVHMTPTEYRWTLNTSPTNPLTATIHAG